MKHIITIIIITLFFATGCKKDNVITEKDNSTKNNTAVNNGNNDKLLKRYLREGFVSKNKFRVIIISPKGYDESLSDIKDKAEKRAQTSLTRYLQMKNRNVSYNTRAQILTIIRNNGSLYKKNIKYKKGKIYYFDITKKRIKSFLYGISSR